MGKLKFTGENVMEGTLENLPSEDYCVEICLRDRDLRDLFDLSSITPPMPLNIGGWTIMKKAIDQYYIYNTENNIGTNVEFDYDEPINLRIESIKNSNKTVFYVNNSMHTVKEGSIPLKSYYRLGFGLLDRKWIGDIKLLRVSERISKEILFEMPKKKMN